MLPLNLPELEVSGLALVTAIKDCPPIADGEGSVVTARFVTREVHVVASVDVLGADGTVETITGTTIHPVWSVDRQEWVPLAELAEGETLQGLDGLAVVLSVSLSRVSQAVYNIEVHGEHVYQVGELGLVVHNSGVDDCARLLNFDFGKHLRALIGDPPKGMIDPHAHHILFKKGIGEAQQELVEEGQRILRNVGIDPIFGAENLVWAPWRVHGQHGIDSLTRVVNKLKELDDLGASYDDFVDALRELGQIAGSRGW
jgi:hypothetical protein